MYYPEGMKARVSPVQSIEPHRILAPTRDFYPESLGPQSRVVTNILPLHIWNALPNHLSSIPTLPAFRRALKHHLFLLAYPNSSAKSGKIKPAQCITLRDTAPTTATYLLLVTCSLCGPRAQGPDIVPCRFSPMFIQSVFEGVRCLRLNHTVWKTVPIIHNSL